MPRSRPEWPSLAKLPPLAVLLTIVGCAGARGPVRWAPVALDGAGWSGDGRRVVHDNRGVEVAVTELSALERSELVERRTGAAVDPFGLTRNGEPFFLTLRLEVRNGSKHGLQLNPGFFQVRVGREHLYAKSMAELWSYLVSTSGERLTLELRKVMLDGSVSLQPGESVEGLLVFRAPAAGSTKGKLEIGPMNTPDGRLDFVFPLEASPETPSP